MKHIGHERYIKHPDLFIQRMAVECYLSEYHNFRIDWRRRCPIRGEVPDSHACLSALVTFGTDVSMGRYGSSKQPVHPDGFTNADVYVKGLSEVELSEDYMTLCDHCHEVIMDIIFLPRVMECPLCKGINDIKVATKPLVNNK